MPDRFEDIEMDKNSAMGIILCVTGAVIAFCLVWYIWWLLVIAGIAALSAIIGRGFVRDSKKIIPASEIEQHYLGWLREVARAHPVTRGEEFEPANDGLAAHPYVGAPQ